MVSATSVRIGLIGSGFMGRAHAYAFAAVGHLFELERRPTLELLADATPALATRAAVELSFHRSTDDWKALVTDPNVDVVSITSPTAMHCEMALAALDAGKSVYCEKPLGADLSEAQRMNDAARRSGAITLVGYNYLRNPLLQIAKTMIDAGELGEIVGFRGIHAEDYMADPNAAFSWRCERRGGGVTADLGSHIISIAQYLVGPIGAINAQQSTVHTTRPDPISGTSRPVEIDDQMQALVRFANGASGSLSASWIAWGRKMQLEFELIGSRGSLVFSQERFNEMRWYRAGQTRGREGFVTLLAGPDHPDYGAFCPAPGHQIGFNDLKIIEVKGLLDALAGRRIAFPDFAGAFEIARVVDAIERSHREQTWVSLSA